jgi:hypothetical protein
MSEIPFVVYFLHYSQYTYFSAAFMSAKRGGHDLSPLFLHGTIVMLEL